MLVRSVIRSVKELKTAINPLNNEFNLNLNLGLDPTPVLENDNHLEGKGGLDKDHVADDATVKTATPEASTEADSDVEDLDISLLTKEDL